MVGGQRSRSPRAHRVHGFVALAFALALATPAGSQDDSGAAQEQPVPPAGAGEAPAPQAATPAQDLPAESAVPAQPPSPGVWHIRSPYATLSKTGLLLDAIGLEVLPGYAVGSTEGSLARMSRRPGVRLSRLFTQALPSGATRTVEIVVAAHPSGGFEIYVHGFELVEGREGPNPELEGIRQAVQFMVGRLTPEEGAEAGAEIDRRQLAYQSYQLSYVESDRAVGLLKALGYSTVEFSESSGETVYDRIFMPNQQDPLRLPVIVKMINASKTSLQESTEDSGTYSYSSSEVLTDLGGIFLHRTTAAEPQNRLMIAYDAYDLDSLERVVNILRDTVDIPARQMLVEALVIEISGDATKDIGVSWNTAGTFNSGSYSDSYGVRVDDLPTLVPPPFTFLFNRRSDTFQFNLQLKALIEESKAKVLSNPSVLVLDGRQAKIQIGNRIPVVETTVTNTSATESILYFPVGIVLNLRPRISEDGSEISMQVETIVSSVRQALVSPTGSTRAPEVESRQVQTFVRVANDTPFIIGGLTTTEEISTQRGVPFFSKIPALGALFRRKTTESVRKEIIIVVTPHIIPDQSKTFSYVIPQESPLFDSFGHELLYNAYRLRQQDVFELDFLLESDALTSLVGCARRYVDEHPDPRQIDPEITSLIEGAVPGEEILVRRMIWEVVRKTNYAGLIDLRRVIFFEEESETSVGGGFKLAFLADKLAERTEQLNGLVLTFDARAAESPERPFGRPSASAAFTLVTPESFAGLLSTGNMRNENGEFAHWSMILSDVYSGTAAPLDVLRGIFVLKAMLRLNPNLPLTIRDFAAGRQLIFPTEGELLQSYDLIDPEVARLFYEVISYYEAFEGEFKHRARRIVEQIGGCPWWDSDRSEAAQ